MLLVTFNSINTHLLSMATKLYPDVVIREPCVKSTPPFRSTAIVGRKSWDGDTGIIPGSTPIQRFSIHGT